MNLKLTTVIIIAAIVQVSASGFAQRVTYARDNVTLDQVFKEIRRQTGYNFLVSVKRINKLGAINVDFKDAPLNEVLEKVLESRSLSYVIDKRTILIKEKPSTIINRIEDLFLQLDIRGRVVDELGNGLAGATVRLKNSSRTVVTSTNGNFEFKNVADNDVLIITFLGYTVREVPVKGNLKAIQLSLSSGKLQEVTVSTGYQSLLKERAPGAFSQIDQSILSKRPVSNLSTALQGMVAGMQARENADGSVNFLVRGNTSLYADRRPLIVLDGFPLADTDFSSINPNDVESVTVLKDAAAASIWGARSANGVIVIITKKSKIARGLKVEANVFTRISALTDLDQSLTQANSADQVAYERLGFANGWFFNQYAGSFSSDIGKPLTLAQELLFANKNGKISAAVMNNGLDSLSRINNRDQVSNLLLRRAILNQYNVNFSSATEKSSSYASLLFENNKTRFQESGYKRYNMNFGNEYRIAKFLTFNFGLNLQHRNQETTGASFSEIQQLSPYETLLNPDGNYSVNLNGKNREQLDLLPLSSFPYADWGYNLLKEVRGRKLSNEYFSARIQTGFNVRLLKGLSFDTKLQYERRKTDYKNYYSDDTYYVRNMVNTMVEYNNTTRVVGKSFIPKGGIEDSNSTNASSYVFRNQLSLIKDFGAKHSINAIAGMEISQYRTDTKVNPWLYGYYPDKLQSTVPIYGYGSSVDQFTNFTGTATTLSGGVTTLGYELQRYLSFYGNASYTYDRKYTVSGSVRSDASNFITEDPSLRWEPLWSVGGLWNIRNENFMEGKLGFVDRLSMRLTHGRNGSVERSTSTKTLLSVSTAPSANTGTITATISDNGNPTLRWEKTTTTNLGLDFTLFNAKLFGKLDAYNKVGTDITGQIALPAATGTTSQKFNNAGITNKGIELELGTNIKLPGLPVLYTTSFNYAYNKNTINNLYYPSLYAYVMTDISNAYVQGRSVNPVYSFTYLGMQNGIPMVAGPNGAATTMNSAALYNQGLGLQFLNYEGTATPPHTLGWYNSFKVKDFSLSVLLIGKLGGVYRNETFNYASATLGSSKTFVNKYVSDVLAGRTDIPGFPKLNETQMYLWDRYVPYLSGLVESSSYIECKEVMLDYTLPKAITNKLKVANLRFYAQARDLGLVWVANKEGYNPDWLPGTDRPLATYTFGLNVSF